MQIIGAIIVLLFVLVKCGNSDPSPKQKAEEMDFKLEWAAKEAVKSRLKDSESAKFGVVAVHGNVVCGTVNAKNSFGGYGGYHQFISNGLPSATFLETDVSKNDWDYIWKEKCG